MADAFPYDEYKSSDLWVIIDTAINNLVENNDLSETTQHDYIVGYLCKCISEINSNK